jgi:hypothetical protein
MNHFYYDLKIYDTIICRDCFRYSKYTNQWKQLDNSAEEIQCDSCGKLHTNEVEDEGKRT